jgi:hypothetical protein
MILSIFAILNDLKSDGIRFRSRLTNFQTNSFSNPQFLLIYSIRSTFVGVTKLMVDRRKKNCVKNVFIRPENWYKNLRFFFHIRFFKDGIPKISLQYFICFLNKL